MSLGDDVDENGLIGYLRECLAGTSRLKSRIRQLLKPSEDGDMLCEADQILDTFLLRQGVNIDSPLSFYDDLHLTGTTCIIRGHVERAFVGRSASSAHISADKENSFLSDISMKRNKSDPSGIMKKVSRQGKIYPWEKNEMKKRYFVISDRFLYE